MLTEFLLFVIVVELLVMIISINTIISDTRDYLAMFINEIIVTLKNEK